MLRKLGYQAKSRSEGDLNAGEVNWGDGELEDLKRPLLCPGAQAGAGRRIWDDGGSSDAESGSYGGT